MWPCCALGLDRIYMWTRKRRVRTLSARTHRGDAAVLILDAAPCTAAAQIARVAARAGRRGRFGPPSRFELKAQQRVAACWLNRGTP